MATVSSMSTLAVSLCYLVLIQLSYLWVSLMGQKNKIQPAFSGHNYNTYTHISFPPLCFLYSVDSFYRNKKLKELVEGTHIVYQYTALLVHTTYITLQHSYTHYFVFDWPQMGVVIRQGTENVAFSASGSLEKWCGSPNYIWRTQAVFQHRHTKKEYLIMIFYTTSQDKHERDILYILVKKRPQKINFFSSNFHYRK